MVEPNKHFTVEGNRLVSDDRVVHHAVPVAHIPNHPVDGVDYHAWMVPTESGHDLQVQGHARGGRIEDHLSGVIREGTGERNLSSRQFTELHSGEQTHLVIMRHPDELKHYVDQVSRMGGASQQRSLRDAQP